MAAWALQSAVRRTVSPPNKFNAIRRFLFSLYFLRAPERSRRLGNTTSLWPPQVSDGTGMLRVSSPGFPTVATQTKRESVALKWYAVQTRSRHEKMVTRQLEGQGFATFLPISTEVRQWS